MDSLPKELAALVPASAQRLREFVARGWLSVQEILASWEKGEVRHIPLIQVNRGDGRFPPCEPLITWRDREYDAETSRLFIRAVQEEFRRRVREVSQEKAPAGQTLACTPEPAAPSPSRSDPQPPPPAGMGMPGLDKVRISPDLLLLIFQILTLYHKDRPLPKSQQAAELDTKIILDNLFRFDRSWQPPDYTKTIEELRPLVRAELRKPEMAYGFELGPALETLRNWKRTNRMKVAGALRVLDEEVTGNIRFDSAGGDAAAEGMATQELICEFFGMDRHTTLSVTTRAVLLALGERVASDKQIGLVQPERCYDLGRLAFYFSRYGQAIDAFTSALAHVPGQKDYLMTFGLVRHYLDEFPEALAAYRRSLAVRTSSRMAKAKPNATDAAIEECKIKLIELLTLKAGKCVSLDGRRVLSGSQSPEPWVIRRQFQRGT